MKRIRRFASSSFQLAMLYVLVVSVTMVASYFYSVSVVADINAHLSAPNPPALAESYLFVQLAPPVLLAMVALGALSFFISEFVVRRINTINEIAEEIMQTGDLSARIPIENEWDDLSKLALTLNHMLAQIERLVQDVRMVSDNIAHDMRTPLTRLQAKSEALHQQLLAESGQHPELEALCEALQAEAEHLLHTFQALLRISQIERGKRLVERVMQPITPLLEDVIDLYEPVAEEKQVALVLAHPEDALPALLMDRHVLFQALANLVDNALKYSPHGQRVTLEARVEAAQMLLAVEDEGPGVPEAEQERIFQRFYRGAQERPLGGNGLGLALVKAVAEQHGGSVQVRNRHPGLRVEMRLPLRV